MDNLIQLADNALGLDEKYSSLTISVLAGVEVLNAIAETSFLDQWDNLYQACPWGTVFQSKQFVCPWYNLYHPEFIPVVVKAETNGRLIGLLTLTIEVEKRVIMAAGLGAAEYQTWLALPSFGEIFITRTLKQLKTLFPKYDIILYNATPNTPIDWAVSDCHWQKYCQIKPNKRLLMDLNNPQVSKVFRKKQFREKTNRLRRIGNLIFEKISDTACFESIIDELAAQSDFRKGAKFNHSEFKHDHLRRQYLIDLFGQGILHTTVLKLDDRIIASIVACVGRGSAHLAGLNTHSPLLSKYSPGTINFIMLGQLLMEEGIDLFDLTPGGDPYKERLATSHDYVHDIYVSSKANTFFKRQIRVPLGDTIKSVLHHYGITPRVLRYTITKFKDRAALAKANKLSDLFSAQYLIKGIRNKKKIIICIPHYNTGSVMKPSVNSLQDLLMYNQQEGCITQWDFLEDALQRFEDGESVYTLKEDGKLIFVAWSSNQSYTESNQPPSPSNTVNIDLLFCHSRATDRLRDILHHVAKEVYPGYNTISCSIESLCGKALKVARAI